MGRITEYRTDPDLCEILVKRSFETMVWMRKKGVKFQAPYGRQAFKVDGRFKFFGGSVIYANGGGEGLAAQAVARRVGLRRAPLRVRRRRVLARCGCRPPSSTMRCCAFRSCGAAAI